MSVADCKFLPLNLTVFKQDVQPESSSFLYMRASVLLARLNVSVRLATSLSPRLAGIS